MGFLSFLTRKPSSNLQDNPALLKAQAYDATVASSPPIRGTRPVAGNGVRVLEQFQKSHPNLSATYLADQAPPPLVPRLRSGSIHSDTFSRPSTARSHQRIEGPSRSRATSGVPDQAPKLNLPPAPKKKYGPYRLPPKVSSTEPSDTGKPGLGVASPAFTRTNASTPSVRSGDSGPTRAYVDLLDAHSLIRPADFYTRVKAAGGRNYGEDVADRNILDSGSDVHSAKGPRSRPVSMSQARGPFISSTVDDTTEDEQPRRPRKRHSMGSGLRTKSTSVWNEEKFPKRTSSRMPYQLQNGENTLNAPSNKGLRESGKAERAARRRSMPAYATASSASKSSRSTHRVRIKETDQSQFPTSLRDRARAAAADSDDAIIAPVKANSSKKQTEPSRKARDSLVYTKSKLTERPFRHTRNDSEQTLPEEVEIRPRSTKQTSRRRAGSHTSSIPEEKTSRRQSYHNGWGPSHADNRDIAPPLPSEPQSLQNSRERNSARRHLGSTTDFHELVHTLPSQQPARVPQAKTSISQEPENKEETGHHVRNRSIVSLSNQSIKPFDIEDSIPERTSSLRHWSLTSETGGSTLSSNPFRPQSGHTAKTSIDLAPMLLPIPDMEGQTDKYSSYLNPPRTSPSRSSARAHRSKPSDDFNIDDYLSSDGSLGSTSQRRGEDEKDLVFADAGYGFDSQLPGLTGMFDAAIPPSRSIPETGPTKSNPKPRDHKAPPTPFHMVAFSATATDERQPKSPARHKGHLLAQGTHSKVSRFQLPAFSYSDSEEADGKVPDESSDDDISFDIPLTRREPMRNYNQGNSRQRYEAEQSPIEEEQDSDPQDIVPRTRKHQNFKPRPRTSNTSIRRDKGKGKEPAHRILQARIDG
ncbi:hypothetical protein F5Y15DRAFT_419545 [Xylariaceae sp. FL0016]|nr:hypothetical protein F5Y15DRAFT_419545 [Xylariaceae sp. FL0016]